MRDRAKEAKASIANVIRRYFAELPLDNRILVDEDLADQIYRQAGRDIYEGWAADMREAGR
jgi:hypothetical protein